jgi:hypothetical protein
MTIVVVDTSENQFDSLKARIASYMHRDDLTDEIPTFISLAESYLVREMQIKELQVSTTLTTTGEYAALPSDFGTVSRLVMTQGGWTWNLDYASDPAMVTSTNTQPTRYALENGQVRIFCAGTGTQATLYYLPAIVPLSVSNTSNWLTENAADLYLYASCLEAAKWMRDDQQAAALAGLVSGALDNVKKFAERRGLPSTGSLQMKVRR